MDSQSLIVIRDALGANMTDMSRILGVSRQAIYTWLRGGGMSPSSRERLSDMVSAVVVFRELGVEPNSYWLNQPVLNGKSFIHLAGSGCSESAAKRLCAVIIRQRAERDILAMRLGARPKSADFSEAGVPHLLGDEAP
jgi:hypothetical protein